METENQTEERYRRIRQLKKFLRPLPRRANLEKYPVLKWFAESARRRDYLWSLHGESMVRAIYIGWVIALIPIYGLQMILAFFICFAFKANCLIAMALQWITNPVSIPFILVAQYFLGDAILQFFITSPNLGSEITSALMDSGGNVWEAFKSLKPLMSAENLEYVMASVLLGGVIIGFAGAFVTAEIYKYWAKKHSVIAK